MKAIKKGKYFDMSRPSCFKRKWGQQGNEMYIGQTISKQKMDIPDRNKMYCVINSRWAVIHTECTWQLRNLVHRVGLNWLVKFSSPSPSFPCRPSPKVYKRPLSETSTYTNRIVYILEERHKEEMISQHIKGCCQVFYQ